MFHINHPWHLAIKSYTKVYFATMNRSGTWYTHFFFEFFENLMTGRKEIKRNHNIDLYNSIQCLKSHTHSIFPEFDKLYDGKLKQKWGSLEFYCNAFNNGYINVEKFPEIFSPIQNPELKIIYLYRNPLDNCVSAFHHYKNHRLNGHRVYRHKITGQLTPFTSPSEYMRNGGLEGYIKQFFTFYVMRGQKNLLMIRYEDLVSDPVSTFTKIIEFMGFEIDNEIKYSAVKTASQMSRPDNLRQIELGIGHGLADDQTIAGGSTMHGGEVGKWRGELTEEDVDYCFNFFERFGISKDFFVLR
tara:strand:+ start:460 stop:1359 length:900 start_codon:yes stop_codon:yes gene_type:complete